jgi:imidazolonepropionase
VTTVVYGASEVFVGPGNGFEADSDAYSESEPRAAPDSVFDSDGTGPSGGGRYRIVEDGAVAIEDGRVVALGPTAEVIDRYPPEAADTALNADGRAVLPGFVDAHTHALFAGDRSDEFAAKLRGKTYQEILAEGGGILRTVEAVRAADQATLVDNLLGHLETMLRHGTTTVEVKSGYGLDRETELRMLEAIDRADRAHPIDLVPTFMGAHAVPADADADDYVDAVVADQLPAVADQGIAEFCDVFCEEGVFSVEQSRRVLEAGLDHGLAPKVHAEELSRLGGSQLAADVGAVSADHLLYATAADATALAEAGVTPVLLPGTAFSLGEGYADPEIFADAGAPVAVATDFNPNCYSHSMGFAVALACVGMGMAPADAVAAATHGGAQAVDRPDRGTLRKGDLGDLVVLDAPTHGHLPYNFGVNSVDAVVKRGEVVHGD